MAWGGARWHGEAQGGMGRRNVAWKQAQDGTSGVGQGGMEAGSGWQDGTSRNDEDAEERCIGRDDADDIITTTAGRKHPTRRRSMPSDRKSTRLNSSHKDTSRMPSSA